jgi:hypothetical protein
MGDEVEDWYKFLSGFLFLILAVPTAAFMLVPSFFTYGIFYFIELTFISIHELGHALFGMPFWFTGYPTDAARFFVVAGGPFLQLAAPLLPAIYFSFVNRRYALVYLFLVLLGYSLYDTGRYMSSANASAGLPYVNSMGQAGLFTGNPDEHDWGFMLKRVGLLEHAVEIAGFIMDFGYVMVFIAFFSALFETILLFSGKKTNDFFVALLYGAAPTFLISIFYLRGTKLALVAVIFLISLVYFLRFKLPKLRKEFDQADEGEETHEEVKSWEEIAADEERLAKEDAK